ncbi:MAG: hypothetical protein Q8M08_08125 [Bacteroidales bacterium]|nr:hypothetical protein [Bacteroidales bacterium]
MAVAIICFGSLINFHQYKIWGKPLIPNFIGYKRDIEKHSKALSFSKISIDNQYHQQDVHGSDFDLAMVDPSVQLRSGTFISFGLFQKAPASNRISSCGLRGPPIS